MKRGSYVSDDLSIRQIYVMSVKERHNHDKEELIA